jgi:transcriptional regulator with XRE-family HTH domain
MTPAQVKAARALLGWTQADLADRANLGTATIADFERGKRRPYPATVAAIVAALAAEGVRLIPALGGGIMLTASSTRNS